jgi:hypothetical protein
VGPRAAAGEDQQASRSGSSPSPLLVRTGGASPSHLQSKPTTQTISALLFFRSVTASFGSASLQISCYCSSSSPLFHVLAARSAGGWRPAVKEIGCCCWWPVCGCRCWRRAAADRLKEMTKVLPRRCRVWAAGSLVRTGLLLTG